MRRPPTTHLRRAVPVAALGLLLLAPAASAAERPPAPTLFPSDRLTVRDPAQITGRRVHLRMPNCARRASDCNDVRLINRLDGFDLDPRVSVGFGRRIVLSRVSARTLYIQRVRGGARIGLNRLVVGPGGRVLYGQPTEFLRERTRYRLVVSPRISGRGASTTFTTMSATLGLERMRAQLDSGAAYRAAGIAAADRGLRIEHSFPALTSLAIFRTDDQGKSLATSPVPDTAVLGVRSYVFGSFASPSWLDRHGTIPAVPSRRGQPRVRGVDRVGFALIVPSSAKPAGGYPVAIFGPGITRSKLDVFLAADLNAQRGIATIAIDPVGHGFGPRSTVRVGATSFDDHGRGRDLDGDGVITDQEGVQAPVQPDRLASIALRDGLRQTALDNMALVRAIGAGADVDGDGTPDLSGENVKLYAQSLGGIYGTMLMGVDPRVRTAVLNVAGGPIQDIARLSPGFRPRAAAELRNRRPPVANGGVEGFTESTPLYGEPPVTAPARGALAIQEVGARVNWIDRSGSPETFAPLLRARPLRGVGPKNVIYQVAYGDRTVPNPTAFTLLHAGGLFDRASVYRNDRTPTASSDPHGFLIDPRLTGRSLGQSQELEFLATDGRSTIDPDGPANVFEVPLADPRELQTLNYAGG